MIRVVASHLPEFDHIALVFALHAHQMLRRQRPIFHNIAILIPGTIVHMCMMDTMRCHMLLRPFTTIMGILIIVFALVNVILSLKKQNGKSQ